MKNKEYFILAVLTCLLSCEAEREKDERKLEARIKRSPTRYAPLFGALSPLSYAPPCEPMLFAEQREYLEGVTSSNATPTPEADVTSRRKRKILRKDKFPLYRWELPIPYVIDEGIYDDAHVSIIKAALKAWEDQTCVRFTPYTGQVVSENVYLNITSLNDGTCRSFTGRRPPDGNNEMTSQTLILSPNICFGVIGTAIHELGHTLGLYHEQSRPDRDEYIDILWDNVDDSLRFNFEAASTDLVSTQDIPYDYGSVMHYAAQAFSKDTDAGLYTSLPWDQTLTTVLGQQTELSFFDAKAVNVAYCSGVCSRTLACRYGGYTDPATDCSQCRCPDGYGGRLCGVITPGSHGCSPNSGGITLQSKGSQCMTSPGYNPIFGRGRFAEGDNCTWVVESPPGCRVRFWFTDAFTMMTSQDGGCQNWLEVKHKSTHIHRGQRFCGSKHDHDEDNKVTSEGSQIMMVFKSPPVGGLNTVADHFYTGFKICAESVCPDDIGSSTTMENDPDSPRPAFLCVLPTECATFTSVQGEFLRVFQMRLEVTPLSFHQDYLDQTTLRHHYLYRRVKCQLKKTFCEMYANLSVDINTVSFRRNGAVMANFSILIKEQSTDPKLEAHNITHVVKQASVHGELNFIKQDIIYDGFGQLTSEGYRKTPTVEKGQLLYSSMLLANICYSSGVTDRTLLLAICASAGVFVLFIFITITLCLTVCKRREKQIDPSTKLTGEQNADNKPNLYSNIMDKSRANAAYFDHKILPEDGNEERGALGRMERWREYGMGPPWQRNPYDQGYQSELDYVHSHSTGKKPRETLSNTMKIN